MNKIFNTILLPENKKQLLEYPCGNGAYMLIFDGINSDGAKSYIKKLCENSFTLFDMHEIPGSVFSQLHSDGLTVFVNSFGESLRIIADPYTENAKLFDKCSRKTKTTLWQHEVDHTLIDCGMCFIIRCCDGSFFVIDSGHYYQVNDNDRIHRFMRERTPAGEIIRIAGWFLTHAHSDHVSKFSDFLRYNTDDCEIEAVYYNFPEAFPPEGAGWKNQGNSIFTVNIENQLKELLHIKKIKLHTGQRFAVRNLNFTVLCTHEDVFPTDDSDFNNTSTVLMMEAEGTKVLFCGDASYAESDILERRWGKLLKCDIVQVAHHGHHGCTESFYNLASASAALFSNTQIFFDLDLIKEKAANEAILKHAKEYYISSNGTVEADLPYKSFKCLPDETFEDFEKIQQFWGYEYTPERKEELYKAYLSRGGKALHSFYRDPNSDGWLET